MSDTQKEVLRQRKKLCLEIAEAIENEFGINTREWNPDKAAQLIEILLPRTYDEAIADYEEFDKETKPTKAGPLVDLGVRLRKALGPGFQDISLVECIKAAVERLEKIP